MAKTEDDQHEPDEKRKPHGVHLRSVIDDAVADGTYSNMATIMFGPAEFFVDFGRVVPGRKDFRVLSRVIMTPAHAKQLAAALTENVRRFERKHGKISGLPEPPAGKLAVH